MTQHRDQFTQSTPELMESLRQPAALEAFEVARANNWLSVDAETLSRVFAADPSHPARAILEPIARTGGTVGLLQYGILSGFFGLAFLLTMFTPQMPPMLFFMWGAIGVALALMTRKYPDIIIKRPAVQPAPSDQP